MNPMWLISLGLFVTSAPPKPVMPSSQRSPDVVVLIEKLPECSSLRAQLEQGKTGDGIEKPYMRPMIDHGVQRAYFELNGVWQHGRANRIRIVRRLYYKQLDGPDAQIADSATLNEIAKSGLEARLDLAAQAKAKTAILYAGIDRWAGFGVFDRWRWQLEGSKIYGAVELFANPWVPRQLPDWVTPFKYRNDLQHAARAGDVFDLAKLVSAHRYSQSELNDALGETVMSAWDNTRAIDMLIKAGADVNARFGYGVTPLMRACWCNIAALLAHGAHPDDRNTSGQTALDRARLRHDEVAVRLLQRAGAKP